MNIIPVLDLMNGKVVHAKHGDRQNYLPIQSVLCSSSQPLAIVDAFLELYPFKQLYIADINAIQKNGDHRNIISSITLAFPNLEIYLDAGFSSTEDINLFNEINVTPVLGSESLTSIEAYQSITNNHAKNILLSLDFKNDVYQGPPALLQDSKYWQNELILMSLSKVGSQSGPDLEKLKHLKKMSPQTKIYAAGGVRDLADLNTLKSENIDGALIASAIHNGNLSQLDLIKAQA
jgi:phosphoribosylformimino-5-aminoimidazole carboxamide ribotide isomerase